MQNIDSLRDEINHINAEMLQLFEKRMKVSAGVALYKKENSIAVFDEKREKEILTHIKSASTPELQDYSVRFFQTLMDLSKEYQKEILNKE